MLGALLLLLALSLYGKKKYHSSLLIFFLFVTNGFQIIPSNWLMNGLPLDKPSDLSIIFIIIISVRKFSNFRKCIKNVPNLRLCVVLILFLSLSALYSLFEMRYAAMNVVQVFRPYLFFFSFVVFFKVEKSILEKVFYSLAKITLILCGLFLLQSYLGQTILLAANGTNNVTTNQLSNGYTRFYNTPAFLIPTLFYFLFVHKFKTRINFYLSLSLLFLTVIGPMHRSLILTIISVLIIYGVLKQKSRNRFIYLSGISVLIFAASFVDVISNRIGDAIEDIASTLNNKLSVQNININDNTMLFRIGHLLERFDYISRLRLGWLFGVGLISDNSKLAEKLPFQNGLISEKTGQVVQVDTGDLIWSPLLLTLGVVGTIIYTYLFIRLLVYFYNNTDESRYAAVGFLTILTGFLTSMAGIEMLSITFRTIIMFLLILVYKEVDYYPTVNRMNSLPVQN